MGCRGRRQAALSARQSLSLSLSEAGSPCAVPLEEQR